jgi:hypothetical protein
MTNSIHPSSCAGRLRGPLLEVGGLLGGSWLAATQLSSTGE